VRALLACVVVSLAAAAALAPAGGATSECRGIQSCIRVPGPWVLVPARGTAQYLLTCPSGGSVVAGLDAQVTSRDVHVDFVGRLGAPVGPGVTTTRYALFRAVSASKRAQFFQPLLGCVPPQGGGGRSTVSARVSPPGPALELRSRVVVIAPGTVRFGRVACRASERLVGSWNAIAFRTKKVPATANVVFVKTRKVVVGKRAVLTASAADALSIDVHAVAQVGVECAP
jgi:hypothetical protein